MAEQFAHLSAPVASHSRKFNMSCLQCVISVFFSLTSLFSLSSYGGEETGNASATVPLLAKLGPATNSHALAFSADGKYLLFPSNDLGSHGNQLVTKWDIKNNEAVWTIDSGHTTSISLVGFSPSGKSFFIGDFRANVSAWTDKDRVGSWKLLEKGIFGLLFGYFVDEDRIFFMTNRNIGMLKNIKTQESKNYIVPGAKGTDNLSWNGTLSRQQRHIALVREKLVGFKNGLELQADYEIELPVTHVSAIAIADDGGLIIGAGSPGRLFQIDVRQRKITKQWNSRPLVEGAEGDPFPGNTYAITYLHNSRSFITAHQSGTVSIWKEAGVLLTSIQVADYPVGSLAVSPDNRMLATAGEIQPVMLWDISALDFK